MANSLNNYRIAPNVFNQASEDGSAQVPPDGANSTWARLIALANNLVGYETVDTTATALSTTIYESRLVVSGTMAFTLAAPTYAGQRKRIVCESAASTPLGVLTITSPDTTTGFALSSTFTFDAPAQCVELIATSGLLWRATRIQRAGSRAVTVGTTVLTSKNLSINYALSVTGTVVSNSTKGLPNGSCAGERCILTNTVAACTPVGSITGVFNGGANTAYTTIGAIGVVASTTVVGDTAVLEWDGSAWNVMYQNGCTLS